jgi:hypothetical protein
MIAISDAVLSLLLKSIYNEKDPIKQLRKLDMVYSEKMISLNACKEIYVSWQRLQNIKAV